MESGSIPSTHMVIHNSLLTPVQTFSYIQTKCQHILKINEKGEIIQNDREYKSSHLARISLMGFIVKIRFRPKFFVVGLQNKGANFIMKGDYSL